MCRGATRVRGAVRRVAGAIGAGDRNGHARVDRLAGSSPELRRL